ncbi:MAG: hypothetical protein NZM26_05215 [Patescibacteria group bacterium]|nr:hypothetical protein [Patescibacteria group bacterium]
MIKKIKSTLFDLNLWIVIIIGVLACRTLIFQEGYFNMHDDLQMMRQLQMEKCFQDGQIPCRWVPDMGYGYGFPLFNFYPPLPYLIGQIFRILGFSFVNTVKYTFSASVILSGVFMYYLSREFLMNSLKIGNLKLHMPAIVSSAFYIWAPYHAVDVYVRGAMNESWALTWFPLIFYTSYKLVTAMKENSRFWFLALAFSYFALFTSHNLMVLIFTPVFFAWLLLILWIENAWGKIPKLFLSGLLSLGMAAFFTLPAIFENKYTQIKSQLEGYYDYNAHFVSLNQLLFSRYWGYGPSVWLEEDKMSFQIGHLHWVLSLVVFVYVFSRLVIKSREEGFIIAFKDKTIMAVLFLFAIGWSSAFMTHVRSINIWMAIDQLKYLQFPWRFLTIVIFSLSFVVGVVFVYIKGRLSLFLCFALIFAVVFSNWNYFLPEYGKMGKLTDEEKFSGVAWELQQTAGIYDYLPVHAKTAPKSPKKETFEFVFGSGAVSKEENGTYWSKGNILVTTDLAQIRINILDFPGWRVFVNGKETKKYIADDEEWGRMYIDLEKGDNFIYVQLFNTPIRTISNLISFGSWVLFFYLMIGKKLLSLRSFYL